MDAAAMEAALQDLIAKGLTFGTCTQAFKANGRVEEAYLNAAKSKQNEGELEIDGNAVVSMSTDNGAYVMAWVWVDDYEIWDGERDSDNQPCLFVNHYHCDGCDLSWTMQWSCACDDECPACEHAHEADEQSIELDITGKPVDEEGA